MQRSLALLLFALAAAALAPVAAPSAKPVATATIDPRAFDLVDLTHPFDADTVYWPTERAGFGRMATAEGMTKHGYFYSAGTIQTAEHGGTHMDAPHHFAEGGVTADAVPLERLLAPAFVIDVSERARSDADYELQIADITVFETRHGAIPQGAAVLLRTGWSQRWPSRREYLGDDAVGDASRLHFPGFGADAMGFLVEQRGVAAVGLDTASLDPGRSTDFRAHRIAAAAGVPGFENLAGLERLPPSGAFLIALPMKIAKGSGAPLRAVAMVAKGR